MKLLLGLLLMVMMSGCAGKDGAMGPTGGPAPLPTYLGYYILTNGGYLNVTADVDGLYNLTSVRIVVANVDGSFGLLPMGAVNNLPVQNGSLMYFANLNYVLASNVKADVGNAVLVGSMMTLVTMTKSNSGFTVRVQISSGTGLVFDHVVSLQ